MPVIECTCGMVMSVSIHGPRASCIRCGGIEFHLLKQSESRPRRGAVVFEMTPRDTTFPTFEFDGTELTASIGSVAVT